MKQAATLAALACALCCMLAAGCKPGTITEKELYYDPTETPDKIAAAGYQEAYIVECCVIFKARFLKNYVGWDIVEMKFFNAADTTTIDFTPVIYEAAAGASAPGDEVSRNAAATAIGPDSWQPIALDTPVTIEAGKDYWAGYRVLTVPNVNFLAEGARFNYGNNRIAFHGTKEFQKSQSNWLVRIKVKKAD